MDDPSAPIPEARTWQEKVLGQLLAETPDEVRSKSKSKDSSKSKSKDRRSDDADDASTVLSTMPPPSESAFARAPLPMGAVENLLAAGLRPRSRGWNKAWEAVAREHWRPSVFGRVLELHGAQWKLTETAAPRSGSAKKDATSCA